MTSPQDELAVRLAYDEVADAGMTEIARLERAAPSNERDSQAVLIA